MEYLQSEKQLTNSRWAWVADPFPNLLVALLYFVSSLALNASINEGLIVPESNNESGRNVGIGDSLISKFIGIPRKDLAIQRINNLIIFYIDQTNRISSNWL